MSDDAVAVLEVRSEDVVVSGEVGAEPWTEAASRARIAGLPICTAGGCSEGVRRGNVRHEFDGVEGEVGGAIAEGMLQSIDILLESRVSSHWSAWRRSLPAIDHSLVEIALTRVTGQDFEKFINAFLPAIIGVEYVPLGGAHDGGADAFEGMGLYEGTQRNTFYQASIQENHKAKIRHTVKRLRESGRNPRSLAYVTAQKIRMLDKDEETLIRETEVSVRIRDAGWIVANINRSTATIAAFESFLKPHLAFLGDVGGATFIENPKHLDSRAVCVFLGQEVERRSKSKLIESVSDSLILWSLEETDPDKEILATRAEIVQRIEEVLPTAKHFIRGVLNNRLKLLSSKNNPTGREIRWYRKTDQFCLPYETRQLVRQENIEDESLKTRVLGDFEACSQEMTEDVSPRTTAHIAHRAIELTFERQGLELAAFLEEKAGEYEELSISDQVDEALQETKLTGEKAVITKEVALAAIRRALYESTEEQRRYFSKLSRTYSLLFSLRADPRIVEYFQSMSSTLVLFVGTDILIRALSERYLRKEDQITCNMLHMIKDAGADLILAQPVVEEIHAHLESTDREFRSDFMETEQYMTIDIARHSPKILIRSYFYARLRPLSRVDSPRGWRSFIDQVCDYNTLHNQRGRDQIRKYLSERFALRFVSTEDLEGLVSVEEVRALADRLELIRSERKRVLADNDAKMVLSVYGKRRATGEEHKANPYGYRTWWLTHETRVRAATIDLVRKRGSQYIMRPEFLLNFIALSPTTEEIRRAYETVFPTLLGVKLSNRIREDLFHKLMQDAT